MSHTCEQQYTLFYQSIFALHFLINRYLDKSDYIN